MEAVLTASRLQPFELGDLLLLDEGELDQLIADELNLQYSFSLLEYLLLREQKSDQDPDKKNILKRIAEFKEKTCRAPGKYFHDHILYLTGGRLCGKLDAADYCKRLAKMRENLANYRQVKKDLPNGAESAASLGLLAALHEYYTEYADIIEAAIGVVALPKMMIAKIVFYAIEEQCPCCDECGGSGRNKKTECEKCGGDGHLRIVEPKIKFDIFRKKPLGDT